MEELIDKNTLLKALRNEKEKFKGKVYKTVICMVDNIVRLLPTTTESEIRAKAIDEAVRKLYNLCYLQTWVKEKDLKQLAEQLKEE